MMRLLENNFGGSHNRCDFVKEIIYHSMTNEAFPLSSVYTGRKMRKSVVIVVDLLVW